MATSTDSGICLLQTSRWSGNGGGEAPAFAKGVVGADNVAPVLAFDVPGARQDRRESGSRFLAATGLDHLAGKRKYSLAVSCCVLRLRLE